MASIKPEDFKKAYKKEEDPCVKIRMAAVNMACFQNVSIKTTADSLMHCRNWVSYGSSASGRAASAPSGIFPGAAGRTR